MEELFTAAENGDIDVVRTLLSQRNYDEAAYYDIALGSAALKNKLDVVVYLVSHGAKVDAKNSSPLYFAAGNGNLSMVKYLLSQGADITASEALPIAARLGRLSIVCELIKQGVNVHDQDDRAMEGGHHDVYELLLDVSSYKRDEPLLISDAHGPDPYELVFRYY